MPTGPAVGKEFPASEAVDELPRLREGNVLKPPETEEPTTIRDMVQKEDDGNETKD